MPLRSLTLCSPTLLQIGDVSRETVSVLLFPQPYPTHSSRSASRARVPPPLPLPGQIAGHLPDAARCERDVSRETAGLVWAVSPKQFAHPGNLSIARGSLPRSQEANTPVAHSRPREPDESSALLVSWFHV